LRKKSRSLRPDVLQVIDEIIDGVGTTVIG
jgi:hypothetical protein